MKSRKVDWPKPLVAWAPEFTPAVRNIVGAMFAGIARAKLEERGECEMAAGMLGCEPAFIASLREVYERPKAVRIAFVKGDPSVQYSDGTVRFMGDVPPVELQVLLEAYRQARHERDDPHGLRGR